MQLINKDIAGADAILHGFREYTGRNTHDCDIAYTKEEAGSTWHTLKNVLVYHRSIL